MAGDMISVIAQATSPSGWVDSPVIRSVSESDAARLSDLLSTQQTQAAPPVAPTPPASTTAVTEVSASTRPGNSIGDQILKSMDSAGKNYKSKAMEIDKMINLESSRVAPHHLLRMQFQLFETSMQVDLISKGISKAVQHIDQVTKLQ
ncbi:type III secretion system inner rod subunit SctI [Caenimonas sp. SL110]|uniref:type III secretion system inner rod subunit SctI n=1 Tax=Caenimonas sp. SL110 TaxID=1450524 RepID=UPI0006535C57|nr:type III secretion system inner rod subunit SctI [Caenimonas sp. SL110]